MTQVYINGVAIQNPAASLLPVVTPPPAPTADMVRAEGARRIAILGQPYSREERETWTQQIAEAEAWTADNAAATPLLDGIVSGGVRTKAELVARVLLLQGQFKVATGAILGAQAKLIAMDPIPADYATSDEWPA